MARSENRRKMQEEARINQIVEERVAVIREAMKKEAVCDPDAAAEAMAITGVVPESEATTAANVKGKTVDSYSGSSCLGLLNCMASAERQRGMEIDNDKKPIAVPVNDTDSDSETRVAASKLQNLTSIRTAKARRLLEAPTGAGARKFSQKLKRKGMYNPYEPTLAAAESETGWFKKKNKSPYPYPFVASSSSSSSGAAACSFRSAADKSLGT